MFNEVVDLSAKIPTWTDNAQNPINQFVPVAEQAYRSVEESVLQAEALRETRNTKLSSIAGKDRTL